MWTLIVTHSAGILVNSGCKQHLWVVNHDNQGHKDVSCLHVHIWLIIRSVFVQDEKGKKIVSQLS